MTTEQITLITGVGLGALTTILRWLDQRALNARADESKERTATVVQKIDKHAKVAGEALVAANNFHVTSVGTAQLAKDTNATAVVSLHELRQMLDANSRDTANVKSTVEELRRMLQVRAGAAPDKPVV